MSYSVQNIRNVALLGHGGNGKTSLVESMLYLTGALDRQGRTADGNTVCDYDAEEIKRQITISTAVAPVEYNGCKINVLDTPGNYDFSGDVQEALRVAELGIIVCDAKSGLSVGTERAWKYLNEHKLPRFIYISKMDEDNGDFNGAFATLREHFGRTIAPLVIPIWDDAKHVTGIVDILNKRAYTLVDGQRQEIPVPEDKVAVVEEQYEALMESVAETSDEFMEKFFSGESFSYAEIMQGLRKGVKDGTMVPVLCGSALTGMGTMVHIPPLRERPEDLAPLISHFLNKYNAKYNKDKRMTDAAMQVMRDYSWPGNIRELQNLLERLVIIGEEARITSAQVLRIIGATDEREYSIQIDEEEGISLKEAVARYEKELLQKALTQYGTTYKAAQALKASQATIARKAKDYGLEW